MRTARFALPDEPSRIIKRGARQTWFTQKRLNEFIGKYDPQIAALLHKVLAKMRSRLPGAVELVYDNYNALVIGFGPTDRPSEALFSVAAYPSHVSLCFLHGASLRDSDCVLKGAGKRVRHLVLDSAEMLDRPAVQSLISQSLAMSDKPFDGRANRIVVRAIAARQRSRRPARH